MARRARQASKVRAHRHQGDEAVDSEFGGGSFRDLDKLKDSVAFGSVSSIFQASADMARLADPLGYGADSIGAEVGDITSELLADTLQRTHPDRHPPERKELARRVTAELLALKPYVFPAPKPDPAPTVESYASANPRRREIGDPSQKPAYPCELCADALPMDYCDACKAEWGKRQQLKREQEDAERLERNRRQRERYKQQRKHCQDLKRFNIEHHLEPESVCETCGMKLKGKRPAISKYCSNACRQRAYVKRGGMGSNARPLSREQIEQAIEQVFAADPDNAFTIYDLCQRVYPGLGEPEKKHRIAIAAAKRLVERQGSSLDILGAATHLAEGWSSTILSA